MRLLIKEHDLTLHIRGNNAIDRAVDQVLEKGVAPSQFTFEIFLLGYIYQIKKIIVWVDWWKNNNTHSEWTVHHFW